MLELRITTSDEWTQHVLANFDEFLVDHAACERKASATGLSFVVKYPDKSKLHEPLISLAREELSHFHQVYKLIAARGLSLRPDTKDPYIAGLLSKARNGRDTHLLDRLLIFAVVEARGIERFGLIAKGIKDVPLQKFYGDIVRSESRHATLFLELASLYFSTKDISCRINELLDIESDIVQNLPVRAALH